MIVASIDLRGGNAVQLGGGEEMAIDAGDPLPIAERFAIAGELAVIDLDAALSTGSNRETIQGLLKVARCRVGGGIRDLETARYWLDEGAAKIILGTRAVPEILRELPKERVIAALDAKHGEVVVEGWRAGTGRGILERIAELKDYVGGFLITFVEREGRLGGTNLDQVEELVKAAHPARVTIAGGVTTAEDIAALDRMGADAQVGMALYSGRLDLADAIAAPLTSDRPDGLWPTVVCDELGTALGLCWSNAESLREAVRQRRGIYHSRRRGLWIKGETSGDVQQLLSVTPDCDRDALRFIVRQAGAGFCHNGTWTCWGEKPGISELARTIQARIENAPEGSYTARLLSEPELLKAKLIEEAGELAAAANKDEAAWEAADLLYFLLTAAAHHGVSLGDIDQELSRRALKVTRRPGNAKS